MNVIIWNNDALWGRLPMRAIGPYKIKHWIKKYGYTAQIIDFINRVDEETLYAATCKFIDSETLVLAISTTFIANVVYKTKENGEDVRFPDHVTAVAARIKQEYPHIKIVLGGHVSDKVYMNGIPHATVWSPEESSPEDIFLEYLNYLRKVGPAPIGKLQFNFIDATSTAARARMIYNKARNTTYNIEVDDFKWEINDVILPEESLPLDVSRGCIFKCRFCQSPHIGKKKLDYIRGMEYIEEELIHNYNTFGTDYYMVLDDTFNDSVIKMEAFYKMTQRLPFKIGYTCYSRADLLDKFKDVPYMMAEGGMVSTIHGIESMHPHASMLLGKGWSGKRAREFLPYVYHDVWKGKIAQQNNYIIGLPQEDEKFVRSIVDFWEENDLFTFQFHLLNVKSPQHSRRIHGIMSEFEKEPEKYGFKFDEAGNWYNDTWTLRRAHQFYSVLNNEVFWEKKLSRNNGWALGIIMKALNVDRDYVLNTKFADMPKERMIEVGQQLYNRYYERLLAL